MKKQLSQITIAAIAIISTLFNNNLSAQGRSPQLNFNQNSPTSKPMLLAQQPPYPLDGKAVYVLQNGSWQEARLIGYGYNTRGGWKYTVAYVDSGNTEQGVTVDRIKSLEEAQAEGIATNVYDLSSSAGIEQMLDAHNQWRQNHGVASLTWSNELANFAQAWANKLIKQDKLEHRFNSPYGENLASAWGQQLSPERVVQMWAGEIKDYDYETNSCASGKVCGHYTQVVWSKTTEVGCAMARSNGREVWVCNYNPPGNILGQKPY
ncbi:MAG: CAP domain-containing protein [Spirulinaceae cyanobacterium]